MMRIGHGYDIHRFESELSPSSYLCLGGVKIPYERALIAHSDGDVVIHAICDALLGACALGDIGKHFPETPLYRKIDSRQLLREVLKKVHAQGYHIQNIDVSIIAEAPKILPYVDLMKENLSADCHISVNDLNIKATTNEGLGAIGNKEGIAVHAVALIYHKQKNNENFNQ